MIEQQELSARYSSLKEQFYELKDAVKNQPLYKRRCGELEDKLTKLKQENGQLRERLSELDEKYQRTQVDKAMMGGYVPQKTHEKVITAKRELEVKVRKLENELKQKEQI